MTWFPIGPDMVYAPRDAAGLRRLSRRNEYGRQSMVYGIAVDPSSPNILYTIDTPVAGGSGAFRSDDGGRSWTPIIDSLLQASPTLTPTCIAVHPTVGNYIYLGTADGNVYVSNNSGQSWGPPQNLAPNKVVRIIVDPRGAANPATTTIYAGTWAGGLFQSTNGGTSWGAALFPGWVSSMAFSMPAAGTAHFYVAIRTIGVYHATNPAGPWTPISGTLPASSSFDEVRIDYAQANPGRVYAWFATAGGADVGLYTTGSGPIGWSQVAAVSPPSPGQGTYSFALAVAPNSPGDGANDILFFASVGLYRSVDAGLGWQLCGDWFHADQHAFAFAPVNPLPGTIPTTLIGCDGGITASASFADPAYAFATTPADFDDGATYNPASGVAQNYNHGKLTSALRHYHADPAASAIGYIGCQDTGVSGHTSALGWRGLWDADGVAVATTPGGDGVKVWCQVGYPFSTFLTTDHGDFSPTATSIALPTGNHINSTSNHVLTTDHKCVSGINPLTDTGNAAIAPGVQTVTPASMAYITAGSLLIVDLSTASEVVTVSSVTATTFTATFGKAHSPHAWIEVFQSLVATIDQAGAATQISQVFGQAAPRVIAASPTDPTLFCLTTQDNRVFVTSGVVPGPATVWAEATSGKPTGATTSWVAIDSAGNIYVLLTSVPGGSTTPLYRISSGAWSAQASSGLPSGPFGPIAVDPMSANTLYAAAQGRVYRLALAAGTWAWTEVGPGLPGPPIQDLWVGNIGSGASPKVLLRAAVASRGVWETDVTAGTGDPPARPYVRDNFLDQGWMIPSPDGLVNPFRPADGISVFHYQCEDIKIDTQQPGAPAFFQTDPEGALPLSHVLFDQLNDNSQNLPGSDAAMVHVEVHNRSYTALNNVSVWAIYASAAAGVPGLNASASMGNAFPFWSQFQAGGAIVPNLPADSPWTAVGLPMVLSGIDAAHPQVGSWNWTIPLLASGDPGHYCMVVFLHSAANPIGETTNYIVDAITPTNPQIGQKNLHIGAPLGPVSGGGGGPIPGGGAGMREYIEFHNPGPEVRIADLVFDLRPLPPELHMWLRLSELQTEAPLEKSMTGIAAIHRPGLADDAKAVLLAGIERGEEILEWLERWLDRAEDKLEGNDDGDDRRPRHKRHPELRFTRPIYRAKPASLVSIRGVRLPAHGVGAALMVIENGGQLPPGSEYRFQVQQVVQRRVVGGSTYVVAIAGLPKLPPPLVAPSHRIDPKTGKPPIMPPTPLRDVPAWMTEIVEERAEVLGKFPPEQEQTIG